MNRILSALIPAVLVLLVSVNTVCIGQDLKTGWELFTQNKRKEAIAAFQKALADKSAHAEAALAISIIANTEADEALAFSSFQDFYKTSDNPYPYMYALWSSDCVTGGFGKKDKAHMEFLTALLADPKANGTLKAKANSVIGYHYQSKGDFTKSGAAFNNVGFIKNWQLLGTFDIFSANGFNKEYGALEKPSADAVFKNKVNADIRWFNVQHIRNDGWLDLEYHFNYGNSIMYAQTFLNSETDQEAVLRLGVSGSTKIWLNDQLAGSVSEERNCDLDVYNYKVKLNKGINRVLIQIGESDINRANLMLRVTNAVGNPLSNVTASRDFQAYTKSTNATITEEPLFAEAYFEERVKQNPNSLLDLLMLATIYNSTEKLYEARKTLNQARALAPECGFISRQLIRTYYKEGNNTQLTKEQDFIKAKDPNHIYSLEIKFDEEYNKENYDEAEKYLNTMISLFGESETTDMYKLKIVANRKDVNKLSAMIDELYSKYPESFDFMSTKYSLETSSSKDLGKANSILKKYLKINHNDDVLTQLASNYFKLGMTSEGLNIYLQRPQKYPYALGTYNDLAGIYNAGRDYQSALKWQLKTIEIAPYSGYYWARLGKIYEALNRTDDAKASYEKAIYYNPTDYTTRKDLRELIGKKDLFEYFEKIDAYDLYSKAPDAKEYPNDNSIILLDETQKIVYPEGGSEQKSELLIKIFNQQGIDTWKHYNIGFNSNTQSLSIEKAEIIKPNGSKIQAETSDNYCVFTALEIGDAIHILYKIENYGSGKLAQHFWDRVNLSYFFPVKIVRYSLLVQESKPFKFKMVNTPIQPTIKKIEDYAFYSWENKDVPAIKSEHFMPPLVDAGASVEISSVPDWDFIANWYSDISTSKAKSDFEVKETVAELFKDKKNLTELQKAKTIYEFIVKHINYSEVAFLQSGIVPQKASTTLNYKLGDCKDVSTLYVAMAKEVGLKANLVLVDTRNNGEKDLILPSPNFNHCIAQVQADGKTYEIELTSSKMSFASHSDYNINALSLKIPQEGSKTGHDLQKLAIPNRVPNTIHRTSDIDFAANDMNVFRKTFKAGAFGSAVRSDYGDISRENQEKDMTQAISSDFTTALKLIDLTFDDLKELKDTVAYSYKFNVKNALTDFAGIKLFKLPWSEAFNYTEYFVLEKRTYDFNLWDLTSVELSTELITIDIPAGKVLAEMPKSGTLSCANAEYSITYTLKGNKLLAERKMRILKDVITPEEYQKAKEFFIKVTEYDTKQIGFK